MADNTTLPIPPGATNGDIVRDIDRAGIKTQVVQLDIGGAAAESLVTGTMPVSGNITEANAELAVTGTFWQATQPVSGTVTVGNASLAVTGPLTDAQLRASAVPVSLAANQSVNAAQINGVTPLMGNGITGTGSMRVTIASDNTAFTVNAAQSGTWNIGTVTTLPALPANQSVNVAQMNGVAVTMGSGVTGTGVQRVVLATDVALPTGANVIGALTANQSVNVAQMNGVATTMGNGIAGTGVQRVAIASDNTAFTVNNTPTAPTASIINSAATTNATSIKASAGTLYSITCSNAGAAAAFVKIYNLATAPTVGTSVIALTIPVAASGSVNINFGAQGMRFGTGIALAITNLVGEADATAVAANQVKVLTSYI